MSMTTQHTPELLTHSLPSTCVDGRADSIDMTFRRDNGAEVSVTLLSQQGEWATWGDSPGVWLGDAHTYPQEDIHQIAREACELASAFEVPSAR